MTTAPATEFIKGPGPVDVDKPAPQDERMWSVTTIIGCLDKPALKWWAAEKTALAAVHSRQTWQAMEQENGTDQAVDWLTRAQFRKDKGALSDTEFGTQLHGLLEEYALTGVRPVPDPKKFLADTPAAVACLEQFDRWLQEFQPAYQAAELTVYNRDYGYAGTCDCFLTIDGMRLIGDYKSSKKGLNKRGEPKPIYPETALQLAGYRFAQLAAIWPARRFESFKRRYYLLSQSEISDSVKLPEVDGGIGIKVTPEFCLAYPLRVDEEVFESFLYVQDAARWQFNLSESAVGEPLQPPAREAAA